MEKDREKMHFPTKIVGTIVTGIHINRVIFSIFYFGSSELLFNCNEWEAVAGAWIEDPLLQTSLRSAFYMPYM